MYRYLTRKNFIMVGSYLLFFIVRGFSYIFFVNSSPESVMAVIRIVTILEYLVVAFIGAYGAFATDTLRSGMLVVVLVKLATELYSVVRLVLRFGGNFVDATPPAIGRVATVTGIALLAALVTNTIVKARGNRE